MKILWLAHEGNMSGANICLLEYLEILKEQGMESHLIVPFSNKMELARAASKKNIVTSHIKFYPWTSPSVNFKHPFKLRAKQWVRNRLAIKEIMKLVEQTNPDFIVTNTIASPVAAIAAQKSNKKHVWFVHEFGEEDHGFTIGGGFLKGAIRMNKLSYKIVFNSLAVENKYKELVPDKKKSIVTNAVVLPQIAVMKNSVESEIKLIMLGQIAASKNHIEAIKALRICKANGLCFELSIVGKEQSLQFLESLHAAVESFDLQEQVKFLGPIKEPAEVLQQHDALLMCSRMEAFGRVTVEALKLGLPVVGANTGGTIEIVENGCNGYLYESGNEKDLADKIMLLKHNYDAFDKEEISMRTREKYNEENTRKQLLEVFR
ncbi:glycosyltransferase family 4 protein [Segetibacter koreensis]|uniref:glycosyltransferase family 4 protein n=1 Tax=Segetibacter koreensis TaxID=398037 RepID=UPI000366DE82|nr:glycosyltransferase family 4 protein [Segetibacter koreensis]